MTIREILSQASAELKSVNIDTPSLDASLLLAHIIGVDRSKLLAMNEDQLSEKIRAEFRSLLDRRINGECVAYIVGKKEFYGLEFMVNSYVLVPRPDTEILVETALDVLGNGEWEVGSGKERAVRILDLCTGSGAIAIALKHELPHAEVYATDISAEALEVAKTNAARLLPNNNNITFLQGDLYNALPQSLVPVPYSLITTNPPYISSAELKSLPPEVQKEPQIALDGGDSGLEIIERIIQDAPQYLIKGGHLLMEADPCQMQSTEILLVNRGFCNIIKYERVIGGMYE